MSLRRPPGLVPTCNPLTLVGSSLPPETPTADGHGHGDILESPPQHQPTTDEPPGESPGAQAVYFADCTSGLASMWTDGLERACYDRSAIPAAAKAIEALFDYRDASMARIVDILDADLQRADTVATMKPESPSLAEHVARIERGIRPGIFACPNCGMIEDRFAKGRAVYCHGCESTFIAGAPPIPPDSCYLPALGRDVAQPGSVPEWGSGSTEAAQTPEESPTEDPDPTRLDRLAELRAKAVDEGQAACRAIKYLKQDRESGTPIPLDWASWAVANARRAATAALVYLVFRRLYNQLILEALAASSRASSRTSNNSAPASVAPPAGTTTSGPSKGND